MIVLRALFALALGTPLLALATDEPETPRPGIAPYEAQYKASYSGFPIKAEHRLTRTGNSYEIQIKARNFLGKITEEELFHMDEQGAIVPDRYRNDRSVMGSTRKESMAVDHASGSILAHRKLNYAVIIRGSIRDYRYERRGEEDLETPMGTLRVLRLERIRDNSDRETELWLAPEFNYQPVLLRQKEDGSSYELTLQSFRFTGESAAVPGAEQQ